MFAIDLYSKLQHIRIAKECAVMAVKSETLSIRVEPRIKAALKKAAECEHRSIANMIEVLVRDYCEKNTIKMDDEVVSDSTGSLEND